MVFTTQSFLFFFLPCCLVLYYAVSAAKKIKCISAFMCKIRAREVILFCISMGFYSWTCFDDGLRFLLYIFVVYIAGMILQRYSENGKYFILGKQNESNMHQLRFATVTLALSVCIILFILTKYKYSAAFTSIWNFLFKETLQGKSVIAPIGISFITFSAISYLADIYHGKAKAGSILDCALYLSMFSKVISGPIVLYRDFRSASDNCHIDIENISYGMTRVMYGFAKKLIIADVFGALISTTENYAIDAPIALGVALLYMLQIYYDFSGYSDIALGLSAMLGYRFKENFDFPYLSCSITEFWRRWHISLGTWFKEYVYIPLGGNRKGKRRTIINILIVFFLTGLWHGVGFAFVIWGMIHGICNALEKLCTDKTFYKKIPKAFKWLFTMIVLYFSWELFRFGSLHSAKNWLITAFGLSGNTTIPYTWRYYFDTRIIFLVAVAILGATVFGLPKVRELRERFIRTKIGYATRQILIVLLFAVSILFMVNSTYNPFLYFQF